MISLDIGMENKLSKRISIEGDIIFPGSTHWNKDEVFIYSGYSKDEQQIARNKFSAGIVVLCNYNF